MTISTLFAIGTILLQIFILLMVVDFILYRFAGVSIPGKKWLKFHGPKIAFVIAVSATIGSLIYSNVVGFDPCSLCWWQRIFLYPSVVVLGLGLLSRDRVYAPMYALYLSGFALLIGVYHSYIQYGGTPLGNCGAATVTCAQRYVWEFGYITLPLMSLTTSVAIVLVILISYRK
ncbi:MAG: disulfide bond formation protein B [Patescibacteria group bacterium]